MKWSSGIKEKDLVQTLQTCNKDAQWAAWSNRFSSTAKRLRFYTQQSMRKQILVETNLLCAATQTEVIENKPTSIFMTTEGSREDENITRRNQSRWHQNHQCAFSSAGLQGHFPAPSNIFTGIR